MVKARIKFLKLRISDIKGSSLFTYVAVMYPYVVLFTFSIKYVPTMYHIAGNFGNHYILQYTQNFIFKPGTPACCRHTSGFLKIAFVCLLVCVRACVHPRALVTSGMI